MSLPLVEVKSLSDGYPYRMTTWPAPARPRGRLLILHGVQSHADWYHNLGRVLASQGFETHFPDRRGSGANMMDRGHAPSSRRLLDDVSEQLEILRSATPLVPVGLGGISWGGKLAVVTAGRRPDLVDALALICPGLQPRVGVTLAERLRIALAFMTNRRKLFPIPLSDPALFTASPQGQEFIAADTYSLRQATAALLAASTFLDRRVRRIHRLVRQPTLLMLAGQDRIVNNARTLRYCRTLATKSLDVIEYPEGHHTLEFESDPNRYALDLARWFDRTLPRT
jgi:alpha-beta hydrolase superfamily lysophospholipase